MHDRIPPPSFYAPARAVREADFLPIDPDARVFLKMEIFEYFRSRRPTKENVGNWNTTRFDV